MIQRILSPLACMALSVACLISVSCEENGGDGTQAVSLDIKEVTDVSVSFTVSASDAELLTYRLVSEYDALPDAETLLRTGIQADPASQQVYTIGDLYPNTGYRIVAAAQLSGGSLSAVAEAAFTTMETDAVVPSISLSDVTPSSSSVTFILVPDSKTEEAFYICVPKTSGVPDAETVASDGFRADISEKLQYSVSGLLPETEYILAAVARSSDGTYSEVAHEEIVTLEAEPAAIGDFYYSDGTWSSGSEAPVSGKECIGIVVHAGRSSTYGSDTGTYYTKDGHSRIDNINGYVVSLTEVAGGTMYAWGSWGVDGDDGAGTSHVSSDFMGYYNTSRIKAKAEEKSGGLSLDAEDNYPATYAAVVLYEDEVPAPETSSGWFLPSAQQLNYLMVQHDVINAAIEKLGGEAVQVYGSGCTYWSSSEYWNQNGSMYWSYYVRLDPAYVGGSINYQRKSNEYKVRPWLVF